jgi:membrane protein
MIRLPFSSRARQARAPKHVVAVALIDAVSRLVLFTAVSAWLRRDEGATALAQAETPEPAFLRRLGGLRVPAGVAYRAWVRFNQDSISMISAGVAFFMLLSIFPGLAAFVALYGLVADVGDAATQLRVLAHILPPDVVSFIRDEITRLAQAQTGGLSVTFVGGLLLAIWSANGAVKALFQGMNMAYDAPEKRGFIRLTLITLAFTVGMIAVLSLMITALVAGPAAAAIFGSHAAMIVQVAGWPLILVVVAVGLALLYRFGPSGAAPRWRWVSWGGAVAAALWMAVSIGFSAYVQTFGHYGRTYGSLGAIIGLMIWLWLSMLIVLAGAELNAEIERTDERERPASAGRPR